MQQAAQIAFNTQTLYAALMGDLPPNKSAASVDLNDLRKKLDHGQPTSETLRNALRSLGVPHPLDGKEDDDNVVTVFLLDMEGTFVPMPFSRWVMFPQMVSHMQSFIATHYPSEEVLVQYLKHAGAKNEALKKAFEEDAAHGHSVTAEVELVRSLLLEHMRTATETQSALPYVKQFQGDVWTDYVEGCKNPVSSRVFSDFVEFVKERGARVASSSSRIFVYSSGCVKVQETVLRHTQAGDLLPYVTGLIDPGMVGSKLVPRSYSKIRSHISSVTGLRKDQFRLIFCTDSPSEASAAETSGSVESSILVVRPGNQWVTIDSFTAVSTPHICSLAQLTRVNPTIDYDALAAEVMDYVRSLSEVE